MNSLRRLGGWQWWLAALVLVTSNVYILSTAYINRASIVQSIKLSERELAIDSSVFSDPESSGVDLKLKWSVKVGCGSYGYPYGRVLLVTNEDYESFMFSNAPGRIGDEEREGWILFELNGPAYDQIVEKIESELKQQESNGGEVSDYETKRLERARSEDTRLIAIDASSSFQRMLDQRNRLAKTASLDQKYLIAKVLVRRPYGECKKSNNVYISKVFFSSINLPAEYGMQLMKSESKSEDSLSYNVDLNIGRLGHPWIGTFFLD